MSSREYVLALAFALVGVGILIYLWTLLSIYPLFDWAVSDISWCQAWLYFSVLDYYGVAICLSAIAMSSESLVLGCLWSLGFFLLGSPACIAWIVSRLLIHKSLTLDEASKRGFASIRRLEEMS